MCTNNITQGKVSLVLNPKSRDLTDPSIALISTHLAQVQSNS